MQSLARILRHTDLVFGIALLLIVAMLILPLPTWLLDIGFVLSLAAATTVLLAAVNAKEPIQFSVFPSLLLVVTLFRLGLAVAATKSILASGDAGRVIETFGALLVGGDFVVGFVIFLILMIVQFIVITNGAGRVAEVAARFTLDAMPGKQMAIDADLAAGLIDENQARERRRLVKKEADFYGAMDGASKFVKGDAIAALLIIVVNVLGGFAVGFLRGEGDAMTILRTYAMLSVGQGLVSQIPALLISTASGLLVTRSGQEQGMGGEVLSQILGQPKAIGAAGAAMLAFAFVPGFPTVTFLAIGGALVALARLLASHPPSPTAVLAPTATAGEAPASGPTPAPAPAAPESVLPLLHVDALEIEIGYALTPLADVRVGGDLPERVTATRRQIALELGFVMPSVRIRDSVGLGATEYVLKVRGEEVARGQADPSRLLALPGPDTLATITGIPTKEPVFQLDALWIEPSQREAAERAGYTVIEPSAMIATHLSEVVKEHAAELLTRQDVNMLLEHAKQENATVVEELVPSVCPIGDVQKVLQHLLRERIPIRDLVTILETMADYAGRVKDVEQLGELVRASIARTITRQFVDDQNRLACITLDAGLEQRLTDQLQHTSVGVLLVMEPQAQQSFVQGLSAAMERAMARGFQPVLLTSNALRLPLRRLCERYLPHLPVLAYNEVSAKADVELVEQVAA